MNDLKLKEKLKAEYNHIYSVSDDSGTEYLFRSLTLNEVKLVEHFILKKTRSGFEIEDFCLRRCLLYPEEIDLDDVSPGVAKQIADEILTVSGVSDASFIVKAMLEARSRLGGDILLDIKSYIISAMPQYTDDELNKYTLLELIEKLILSEKILTLQGKLAGLDSNVELQLTYSSETDNLADEEYEVVKKTSSKKDKPIPSKEELLKRIAANNEASQNRNFNAYSNKNALKEFQGFDVDLLQKMEGKFDPNDPIARKLHGLG